MTKLIQWLYEKVPNRSVISLLLNITNVSSREEWEELSVTKVIASFAQHTQCTSLPFILSRSHQTQLGVMNRLWHKCHKVGSLTYHNFQTQLACLPPCPSGVKQTYWKQAHTTAEAMRAWAPAFLETGATRLLSVGWSVSTVEKKLADAMNALLQHIPPIETESDLHALTNDQILSMTAALPNHGTPAHVRAGTLFVTLPQFKEGDCVRVCKRETTGCHLTEEQQILLLRMKERVLDAQLDVDSPRLLIAILRLSTEQDWMDMSILEFADRFAEGFGISKSRPVIPPRLDKQLSNARKLWIAYKKPGCVTHSTLLLHIMKVCLPPRGISAERWKTIHEMSELKSWMPQCLFAVCEAIAKNPRVAAPSTTRRYMNGVYRILLAVPRDILSFSDLATLSIEDIRIAVRILATRTIVRHHPVRCSGARDPRACREDILVQCAQFLVDALPQFADGTVFDHPGATTLYQDVTDDTQLDDPHVSMMDILKPSELEAMWHAAITPKEQIVFLLLRHTGMRVGALIRLRMRGILSAVDGSVRSYIRAFDKNHRTTPSEFFLNDVVRQHMLKYLELVRSNSAAVLTNAYVFPCSKYIAAPAHHMSASAVARILWRLAGRAHVHSDAVHAHAFRKTLATELYLNGNTALDISKFLHHTSVDVTLKHYIKCSYEQLVQKIGQNATTHGNGLNQSCDFMIPTNQC